MASYIDIDYIHAIQKGLGSGIIIIITTLANIASYIKVGLPCTNCVHTTAIYHYGSTNHPNKV